MTRIKLLLTIFSLLSINFIFSQVSIFTSGYTTNILQDYEFVFGVGNVNMTAGNIITDNITGFDVVIVNSINQTYNASLVPKLVTYINSGGHVILAAEGGMVGSNRFMSTTWNALTGQSITETPAAASGTSTPPRYHNSNGPWLSSPDVQLTGSTTSYASFGNMNVLNVTHQRQLSPPTCDNIEALSAVYPSHPNLGDGTLYIQGEVQYPFMNYMNSVEVQRHARALVRMHYALLNNNQVLLDSLNSWVPNLAVETDFLSVKDTAFCDSNFPPFPITAPSKYSTYSWEDINGNVLGTNSTFNVSQSGVYIIKADGTPPICDGIDTLTVEVDNLIFSSISVASCFNTQDGELLVDNVSANYLAQPITYTLDNTIQPGDNLFLNLSPGSYNLVVEDARGCIDSATVYIDGLEIPTPNFSFDTVCLDDPTSFTDLSSITTGNISNWEWTIDNTVDNNQNTTYTFTVLNNVVQLKVISDAGCMDSISHNVILNPLPEANITGDIEVCLDAPEPQISFTGSNSTAPYTFNYTLNGGTQQSVTSTGNIATVNVPTNTIGTYTYELVSVEDASSTTCTNIQTGTVVITVNPLPTATIDGTTNICQDDTEPQITFTGADGTAPYEFTYTINDGTNTTTETVSTTSGNSVTVDAPTVVSGTYTYELVSVENNSSTTCLNNQTGTVTITVNPLPTATIDGTTNVCQNETEPQVTFTGVDGTAPYTFTYTIDNGTSSTTETVSTTTGNSVAVSAPTDVIGAFTYDLISVQDASSTTCTNNQTGTSIIIVNPLPTAIIDGTTDICQDDTDPQITFTGADGTAPYTFTYTINGGSQQTIVSTIGNSVTVNASTDVAGTFSYDLVSVQDNSSTTCFNNQSGTVTITVNPLPTATIDGATNVCQNNAEPQITFTGADGTAPYTFTYTSDDGTSTTTETVSTTSGNSVTVNTPTDIVGTFSYELVSVQDNSSTTCYNEQSGIVIITVNPLPTATIFGPDKICQFTTSNILFEGTNSTGDYTFSYNINKGTNQTINTNGGNDATTPLSTDIPGLYDYELTHVEDPATGCFTDMSQTVTVEVVTQPIAIFHPDPDQLTSYNWESQMVNESLNSDYFYWDFGDGSNSSSEYSPTHEFPNEKTANYAVMLIAYSPNGLCVDTTYKFVQFKNELLFYVPNTFTPDGDQHNNTFLPIFTAGYDPNDYTLMIFNRWGEMIFESHNASIGWDGTYQGRIVQDDTYVWKIEVQKTLTATREEFVGNVNLIR